MISKTTFLHDRAITLTATGTTELNNTIPATAFNVGFILDVTAATLGAAPQIDINIEHRVSTPDTTDWLGLATVSGITATGLYVVFNDELITRHPFCKVRLNVTRFDDSTSITLKPYYTCTL